MLNKKSESEQFVLTTIIPFIYEMFSNKRATIIVV